MKKKFSKREEFDADIRNKLTMPLTVLNQFMEGKTMPKENIKLAIKSLNEILEVLQK